MLRYAPARVLSVSVAGEPVEHGEVFDVLEPLPEELPPHRRRGALVTNVTIGRGVERVPLASGALAQARPLLWVGDHRVCRVPKRVAAQDVGMLPWIGPKPASQREPTQRSLEPCVTARGVPEHERMMASRGGCGRVSGN